MSSPLIRTYRWSPRLVLLCLLFVANSALFLRSAAAAPTEEQTALRKQIQADLNDVATHSRQREFDAARESLLAAQNAYAMLLATGDSRDVQRIAARLHRSIVRYRKQLASRGVDLPPFAGESDDAPDQRGFTRDVAPIFVSHCGSCHIRRTRGGLSLRSFTSLAAGGESGPVIVPGASTQSRLFQLVASGAMPPTDDDLDEQELQVVADWIDAGAKFDGEDPRADLAPSGNPAGPATQLLAATDDDTLRFSRDVAPHLVENCLVCHGGNQPRARLSLDRFAGILRGGDNGPIIDRDDPSQSLLIRKLRGTADGAQMPAGGAPPLPDEVIETIESWIRAGARYDGSTPNIDLETLVQLDRAARMSPEELAESRWQSALRNWHLGDPERPPRTVRSDDFVVLGLAAESRLQELHDLTRSVADDLESVLRFPDVDSLLPAPITIFTFDKRFDYSEFVTMVENRQLPPTGAAGHWNYSVVDAYLCIAPDGDSADPMEDDAVRGLIAEQLAGLVIDSAATTPRWFNRGAARALAAKVAPRDPRVEDWRDQARSGWAEFRRRQPTDDGAFPTERLDPVTASAIEFLFAGELIEDSRRFRQLLRDLRDGAEFEDAFRAAYRRAPVDLVRGWNPR